MKTLRWMLSLALLCWCLSSHANSTPDSTAVPRDSLLGALDLSQVPSGLLAEAAFPMLDLHLYSGQIINDTNRLVLDVYGMLYGQLSGAVVDTNELLPPPAYMDARDTINSSTIIPIGVLAYEYHG